MAAIKGQCACGQVHYEATGEPAFSGLCHCKTCQRTTGSAFNPVIAVPTAALKITGTLKTHTYAGDSGKTVVRKFCPDCGSGIVSQPEVIPDLSIISLGTLDDSSWVTPGMQIYCDDKQHWVSLAGEWQMFPKMPMPG
jgi:hypothetical protein